jgi:hypothetical protein
VTPDYINPRHPWPHLATLADTCARHGYTLRPRLPIYDRYRAREGFLDPALIEPVLAAQARLATFAAAPPAEVESRPSVEREVRA